MVGRRFAGLVALCGAAAACSAAADDQAATREEQAGGATPATSAAADAPANGPTVPGRQAIDPMALRASYTEHLGRLTTTALSPPPTGMLGTDLGSSFTRDGKVVFLFGDTVGDNASLTDVDTVATASLGLPQLGVPGLT